MLRFAIVRANVGKAASKTRLGRQERPFPVGRDFFCFFFFFVFFISRTLTNRGAGISSVSEALRFGKFN